MPERSGGSVGLGRFWLLAALLWATWLLVSLLILPPRLAAPQTLWDLQDPAAFADWLRAVAAVCALRLAECFLWGLLVALAVTYRRPNRSRGIGALALAWVVSAGLATGLILVAGRLVALAAIPVALACLLGVWVGWSWSRGPRARRWLLLQFVLALVLTITGLGYVSRSVLQSTPLDLPALAVTSADKRHLVAVLQSPVDEDGFQYLRLTSHDLDLLLSWALSIESLGCRAGLRLADDSFLLQTSLPLRCRGYVNIHAAARMRVEADLVEFGMLDLRIGRVHIPRWLMDVAARQTLRWVAADPDALALLRATRLLEIREDAVTLVIQRELSRQRVRELIVRLSDPGQQAGAVRTYVAHLLAAADELPSGEAKFAGLVQAAFQLAESRSQRGDPIQENRAAIYALGIVMGHVHVQWATGRVLDHRLRREVGRHMGRATVRGRADWVRHYCVSAALALYSSENASDAAGLLKEELDAATGGSGFSFSDLLANRAGTTLALTATSEPAAARRIQQALSGPWLVEQIFPPAADLPEGLSDAQLQAQFGGIGGAGYQQLLEEIEARVRKTLPAQLAGDSVRRGNGAMGRGAERQGSELQSPSIPVFQYSSTPLPRYSKTPTDTPSHRPPPVYPGLSMGVNLMTNWG